MMKSLENELQSITVTVFGYLNTISSVVTIPKRRCCKFKERVSTCERSKSFSNFVMVRM